MSRPEDHTDKESFWTAGYVVGQVQRAGRSAFRCLLFVLAATVFSWLVAELWQAGLTIAAIGLLAAWFVGLLPWLFWGWLLISDLISHANDDGIVWVAFLDEFVRQCSGDRELTFDLSRLGIWVIPWMVFGVLNYLTNPLTPILIWGLQEVVKLPADERRVQNLIAEARRELEAGGTVRPRYIVPVLLGRMGLAIASAQETW